MTNVDGVLNKEKKLINEISSSEILKMIKDETKKPQHLSMVSMSVA